MSGILVKVYGAPASGKTEFISKVKEALGDKLKIIEIDAESTGKALELLMIQNDVVIVEYPK